jgi:hypothetical protein
LDRYNEQSEEDAFRKIVESVRPDTTPSPGFKDRLRARLLAAAQSPADRLVLVQRPAKARKHPWRLRIASAAAAVILGSFAVWVFVGNNVEKASASFAEVLQHLRAATSVAFDKITISPGIPEENVHIQMAYPGRFRATYPDGRVHITNMVKHESLGLSPEEKKARILKLPSDVTHDEPIENLRNAGVSDGRLVGREVLHGQTTEVYEVAQPQSVLRVWVDPHEQLPVRMEVRSRTSAGAEVVAKMSNFRWNEPVSDSLFAMDVPPGYTLEQPQREGSEKALVDLLRICGQMSHGRFPQRLDATSVLDLFLKNDPERDAIQPQAQGDETPTSTYMDEKAKEMYRTCLRGLAFIDLVAENGSWQYRGQGVKLGDGAAPVCWWQTPGSATYRVIYGDLQIRDVEPARLPARQPDSDPARGNP